MLYNCADPAFTGVYLDSVHLTILIVRSAHWMRGKITFNLIACRRKSSFRFLNNWFGKLWSHGVQNATDPFVSSNFWSSLCILIIIGFWKKNVNIRNRNFLSRGRRRSLKLMDSTEKTEIAVLTSGVHCETNSGQSSDRHKIFNS